MLYFDISPNIVIFKGQLKCWDKLTYIARFQNPENGFEGIFEKFVFVLEISAVKVEELCGTKSRFSSFSKNYCRAISVYALSTKLIFIQNTKILIPQSRAPRQLILKIFKEHFVVSLWNFKE